MRILASSARALLFTDETGIIVYANHNAETLLEQESITGRGLFDFFENPEELQKSIINTAKRSTFGEITCKMREENDLIKLRMSILSEESQDFKRIFVTMIKLSPTF
jgi:PAS domain-containing protein